MFVNYNFRKLKLPKIELFDLKNILILMILQFPQQYRPPPPCRYSSALNFSCRRPPAHRLCALQSLSSSAPPREFSSRFSSASLPPSVLPSVCPFDASPVMPFSLCFPLRPLWLPCSIDRWTVGPFVRWAVGPLDRWTVCPHFLLLPSYFSLFTSRSSPPRFRPGHCSGSAFWGLTVASRGHPIRHSAFVIRHFPFLFPSAPPRLRVSLFPFDRLTVGSLNRWFVGSFNRISSFLLLTSSSSPLPLCASAPPREPFFCSTVGPFDR